MVGPYIISWKQSEATRTPNYIIVRWGWYSPNPNWPILPWTPAEYERQYEAIEAFEDRRFKVATGR